MSANVAKLGFKALLYFFVPEFQIPSPFTLLLDYFNQNLEFQILHFRLQDNIIEGNFVVGGRFLSEAYMAGKKGESCCAGARLKRNMWNQPPDSFPCGTYRSHALSPLGPCMKMFLSCGTICFRRAMTRARHSCSRD